MSEQSTAGALASPQGLSAAQSRAYWDKRHASASALASGGNIGFDEPTNAMLYAVRAARLVTALGPGTDPGAARRVLDAGCGKGYYTRVLSAYGHRVDGIDTSPHAIAECRSLAGPRQSYHVSALTDWSPAYLYDAIVSIDVLYHLMDDVEWEASVRHLASLVRLGGRIGLVDHDRDEDKVWRDYQKTRANGRYREVLESCGFVVLDFIRNDFHDDPSGMHLAVRVS
ncbi:hypothetical protein GCM10022415_03550 [Knoellia locipacati]|uniref:Methyltransferase domain-containing protein n=1 Tax=Knoellia locipacati TaxID=882824 RepID=A0A512SWJ7_9MICO|nr:class I SAM-dependent methyltransferase [Knoellia locipacati]GEQ12307.1 hypothetical protein KLO01_03540 [Knoellia locipacati]